MWNWGWVLIEVFLLFGYDTNERDIFKCIFSPERWKYVHIFRMLHVARTCVSSTRYLRWMYCCSIRIYYLTIRKHSKYITKKWMINPFIYMNRNIWKLCFKWLYCWNYMTVLYCELISSYWQWVIYSETDHKSSFMYKLLKLRCLRS